MGYRRILIINRRATGLNKSAGQRHFPMFYFIFLLKHDNGMSILKTSASSLEAAIEKVMQAEHCPKRAITLLSSEQISEALVF